jgi:endoglucanase
MIKKNLLAASAVSILAVTGCSSIEQPLATLDFTNFDVHEYSSAIKLNQVGYFANASKIVIVPSTNIVKFNVINANGSIVLSGISSAPAVWEYSGEAVVQIDLSALNAVGQYSLEVEDSQQRASFSIKASPYDAMHKAAFKAYYINRASIKLLPEFAGDYARPMGHVDTQVLVHSSAATASRPEGTVISSPKGWYDAGDYNKYIVNSGISTYTLLLAYEHFTAYYDNKSLNIPESNNGIPDILDEIDWNLEWMSTMQDPNDGGVYHKLTTKNFTPIIMPHEGTEPRFVVQKSTAAALNFAAVMANASRLYQATRPTLANKYLLQAIDAYSWALENPTQYYRQPSDIQTGEYGDNNVTDEFAWASAELYLTTQEPPFLENFDQYAQAAQVPSWAQVSALPYISMAFNNQADILFTEQQRQRYSTRLVDLANNIMQTYNTSAYKVAMSEGDFVWGSNAVAMNRALVLWQAHKITQDEQYKVAAEELVNYVMGKNPTGFSFVTGFGEVSPIEPHHRQSVADEVLTPVPGFLVGGPHSGQQDSCNYVSDLPAQSFLDDWCSYSTNEVTINWNAPLIYSLAQLEYLYK